MQKALVADDSLLLLKLVERTLTDIEPDIEVLTAGNGALAWELWQEHRPKISVLDIHMPEIDGIELLQRIKTEDPSAVVVILTADRRGATADRCTELGADGFVNKDRSDLRDTLAGLMKSTEEVQ